jgi:hypothetical protein
MNKMLKYSILITLCFWVVAAPTCEDEISPVDARMDHLERLETVSEVFASESLSDDNLEAFEFKAVEKLMDFTDYMGIIYGDRYAESFRQQARRNIAAYFSTGEYAEMALNPTGVSAAYDSHHFYIDSVDIINPLSQEANTRYSGSMRYAEMILGINPNDTILLSHSQMTIEIILEMDYKDFGENSLLVWEVLLGKITPVE